MITNAWLDGAREKARSGIKYLDGVIRDERADMEAAEKAGRTRLKDLHESIIKDATHMRGLYEQHLAELERLTMDRDGHLTY